MTPPLRERIERELFALPTPTQRTLDAILDIVREGIDAAEAKVAAAEERAYTAEERAEMTEAEAEERAYTAEERAEMAEAEAEELRAELARFLKKEIEE